MWPGLGLSGIGKEVHDDGTTGDGLIDLEEVLALNPSVLLGLLPRLSTLADTDDDIETLIAGVKTLAVTLGACKRESAMRKTFKELQWAYHSRSWQECHP